MIFSPFFADYFLKKLECSSPVCRTKLESLQILYLQGFASFLFYVDFAFGCCLGVTVIKI
jgi:hypothetical protein